MNLSIRILSILSIRAACSVLVLQNLCRCDFECPFLRFECNKIVSRAPVDDLACVVISKFPVMPTSWSPLILIYRPNSCSLSMRRTFAKWMRYPHPPQNLTSTTRAPFPLLVSSYFVGSAPIVQSDSFKCCWLLHASQLS